MIAALSGCSSDGRRRHACTVAKTPARIHLALTPARSDVILLHNSGLLSMPLYLKPICPRERIRLTHL
jgi:hypothetical protein